MTSDRVLISQVSPYIGSDEYQSLQSCFSDKWLTEGPKTKSFVDRFKSLTSTSYCFPVPNGTLALYLSLLALKPSPGDEIIIPSFTFFASASAAHFAGFKPVFCDVDPKTFTVDYKSFISLVNKNTRAAMFVNIYGGSIDFSKILEFCSSAGIKLIEDSAQAFGVFINNKHSGTFGDIGTFSFFAEQCNHSSNVTYSNIAI